MAKYHLKFCRKTGSVFFVDQIKMSHSLIFCCFIISLGCGLCDNEKYTIKYDNLDVDEIIKNPRILKNYVNCVVAKGKCTAEGEELKSELIRNLNNTYII